jgi:hypothetical protein
MKKSKINFPTEPSILVSRDLRKALKTNKEGSKMKKKKQVKKAKERSSKVKKPKQFWIMIGCDKKIIEHRLVSEVEAFAAYQALTADEYCPMCEE